MHILVRNILNVLIKDKNAIYEMSWSLIMKLLLLLYTEEIKQSIHTGKY